MVSMHFGQFEQIHRDVVHGERHAIGKSEVEVRRTAIRVAPDVRGQRRSRARTARSALPARCRQSRAAWPHQGMSHARSWPARAPRQCAVRTAGRRASRMNSSRTSSAWQRVAPAANAPSRSSPSGIPVTEIQRDGNHVAVGARALQSTVADSSSPKYATTTRLVIRLVSVRSFQASDARCSSVLRVDCAQRASRHTTRIVSSPASVPTTSGSRARSRARPSSCA